MGILLELNYLLNKTKSANPKVTEFLFNKNNNSDLKSIGHLYKIKLLHFIIKNIIVLFYIMYSDGINIIYDPKNAIPQEIIKNDKYKAFIELLSNKTPNETIIINNKEIKIKTTIYDKKMVVIYIFINILYNMQTQIYGTYLSRIITKSKITMVDIDIVLLLRTLLTTNINNITFLLDILNHNKDDDIEILNTYNNITIKGGEFEEEEEFEIL